MREDLTITYPPTGRTAQVRINTRCRAQFKTKIQNWFKLQEKVISGETVLVGLDPQHVDELRAAVLAEYPKWRIQVDDRRPVYTNPGDRVGWTHTRGAYGSLETVGLVGDMVMFRLVQPYVARLGQPVKYHLVAHFNTGKTNTRGSFITGEFESAEAAKASAETALTDFLAKLGAVWARFPESVIPSTD